MRTSHRTSEAEYTDRFLRHALSYKIPTATLLGETRRDAINLEGELDDADPESLASADFPSPQPAIPRPSRSPGPALHSASLQLFVPFRLGLSVTAVSAPMSIASACRRIR